MKDIPTSPRIVLLKRNRRVKRLRLIILFFLLFISIVGGLSYFSFNPKININTINVKGNSIIDDNELKSFVAKEISSKYFHLFPYSNFLIYPKNKIYNKLLIEFPRIESLGLNVENYNILNIEIKERAGAYLYCGLNLPEDKNEIGENCYFVNNDGYIFDKAPYFSGSVYLKFYTKIQGNDLNPLGSQMFPTEKFHSLINFIEGINSLGFNTSHLVLSSDNIYSLHLISKKENVDPIIIFKEENDLIIILDNLKTAMTEKEFKDEIFLKYDNLLYVDLRFKNKVLYKFQ